MTSQAPVSLCLVVVWIASLGAGMPARAGAPSCLEEASDCSLREMGDEVGILLGAAASAGTISSEPLYGETLAREYSSVTAEVHMKWDALQRTQGVFTFAAADALLDFAEANEMAVHGHTLVWNQRFVDSTPDWVEEISDEEELRSALTTHITTVLEHFDGRVASWDVVNEPLTTAGAEIHQNHFYDLLGPGYIAESFAIAHAADPDAELFLNEVGVLFDEDRFAALYELVRGLLEQGVPIHGVGFQGHFLTPSLPTDFEQMRRHLKAMANLGLIVEITELDVGLGRNIEEPLALQRERYFTVASACAAVSACRRITTWGFTDKHSWYNGFLGTESAPLPFDDSYVRKPAYLGLRDGVASRSLGEFAPAFPGAVGFGSRAVGGRGGDVYHVTHLADAGAGSLRDAIESATGPRTIVFEVGGTIDLSQPLGIGKSMLTIAGQTAPGGIGTRGYPVQISGAQDVVVRFVRFRTGDINAAAVFDKPARGNGDLVGDAGDGLSIGSSQRVILDHVSASWGMDETLSVTNSADVTVQHSIISEGLDDSYHTEGKHGYGSLIRGTGVGGYSLVGNLYAHHTWRSPAVGGLQTPEKGEPRPGLDVDVVNNVIYDWKSFSSHTVSGLGTTRLSFLGNVSIAGPSTDPICVACSFSTFPWDILEDDVMMIHRSDNVIDSDKDATHDPVPSTEANFTGRYTDVLASFDFTRPEFPVVSAADAYQSVLAGAGASLARDAIDARIVQEVMARAGGIVDSQDDVGGWPAPPEPAPAPEDLDRDGMADAWEDERGLDPADPEDRNDYDLDVDYTNLEVYLDVVATAVPEPGSGAAWSVVGALAAMSRRRCRLGHSTLRT